jgi:hypothetical protein
MGSLSWIRAARRAVGMTPQAEFPHLEALMEAEEGQPHYDYRVCAKVIPPIVAGIGVVASIALVAIFRNQAIIFGAFGAGAIATGLWFLFDWLDRRIPRSKAQLRKMSEGIWQRYKGFANMLGINPTLSPRVAAVLDEAASIYLKHFNAADTRKEVQGEPRARALQALEEAMARLLELGQPQTPEAQDLELAAGWAQPLLQEMRDMDYALDRHLQTAIAAQAINSADPRANLRDARIELLGNQTAIEELEQDYRA